MNIPQKAYPIPPYLMVGSLIPGVRIEVQRGGVRTYMDVSLNGGMHPLLKKRKAREEDPVKSYPDMHQEHGENHAFFKKFMEKVKGMMKRPGGGEKGMENKPRSSVPSTPGPSTPVPSTPAHSTKRPNPFTPKMREGFKPWKENLDWRRS